MSKQVFAATHLAERVERNKGKPFHFETELLNQDKILESRKDNPFPEVGAINMSSLNTQEAELNAMLARKGNNQSSKMGIDHGKGKGGKVEKHRFHSPPSLPFVKDPSGEIQIGKPGKV